MNNIKKYLTISSIILIIITLLIPTYNYFVGTDLVNEYIQTKYILNLIVANSNISFEDISSSLIYVVLAKDGLVILFTLWFQLLFIFTTRYLIRKDKGLITYIFALLFHLLSYVGIIVSYYFYINLTVEVTFITIQTYALIVAQVINSLLFLVFTGLLIREKLRNIMPLTEISFLSAIYFLLKVTTVILIIIFTVTTVSFVALYNITLLVISNISFETLFNLPNTLQYDVLSIFSSIPDEINFILSSIEYKHWLFEVVNGEILINISNLSTRVQSELSYYANLFFTTYFPTIVKLYAYYVIMQFTNYLHKRLNFKNIFPLIFMIITIMVAIVALPKIDELVIVNRFIIVLIILYTIFMIDNLFANYRYTLIVCNAINNFKFSNSFNEFTDEVKSSLNTAKDKTKKTYSNVKENSKDYIKEKKSKKKK